MRRLSVLLLLAIASCAPGGNQPPAVDSAALEAELLEADRAFARATAERGLEGWLSFFAEDAARVEMHGRIIRGLASMREYDARLLDDPTLALQWDPTDAGIFGEGEVGFTRGRYELVRTAPGQAPERASAGAYLTIWQRREEGWRVVLDTGDPDETEE